MAKSLFRALVALSFLAPLWLNAAPRVITLSPANTELAFAAGITPVGVSSYSDYPPQAQKIEQVSTWQGMNLERIVALKPDLVIAWRGGNAERHELQGYRVISGLLEIYRPLLSLSLSDFTELVEKERVKRFPIESRLFHKLSTRHRLAYVEAVSKLPSDSPEFPLWEYYYRCRLLQDYISGMTDLYAWDEYRRLMAVEQ